MSQVLLAMLFRVLVLFLISTTCSAQYGALDTSFDPAPGAEQAGGTFDVLCSQLQADGRILIGGKFTSYNGAERRGIARVLPDGSVDPSFDPGAGAQSGGVPSVEAMALLPDGKILVAGDFTSWNGEPAGRITRLNADGSLDPTFIPGGGANQLITSMVVLPDGKILIAGAFTAFTGTFRSRIARLNANGVLDTTFDPGDGPGGTIRTILDLQVQSNGRIFITGHFESFAGVPRSRVARLMPTGELDGTFSTGGGPNGPVFAAALQANGRLLIGGSFTTYSGVARARVARLNANGTLDTEFVVGTGADNVVHAIMVRPDGRIMIGGDMLTYNGITTNQLAGLLSDGSYDPSFDPGSGTTTSNTRTVLHFMEQPDARILVLGKYYEYDGVVRRGVARILPCTLPVAGTITVDPVAACVGDAVTFSVVDGVLNESAQWAWYAEACGGELLGTGSSIVTEAVAGTTVHLRGEGGCTGTCIPVAWSPQQPEAGVVLEGGELTATLDGATYQWVDCSIGNEPIQGATEQVFVPLVNGAYAVIVTMDGCSALSECVSILSVGTTMRTVQRSLSVHPNPTSDRVWIHVPEELKGQRFMLHDATGRVAAQGLLNAERSELNMDHLAPGPYLLSPLEAGGFVPVRILKL